jgi:crotonobetainyl-CoA:carnitine CoA-transferase CaiB-like acyl-CoA transferase
MPSLAGVTVVSVALNAPGPLVVSRLVAEGARVTKIEPLGGDPLEGFCPTWYAELHRGVAVERLDLKAEGSSRMRRLLANADLLLASQRPAALARLGLDADALLRSSAAAPRLRHLNIVGEVARPEVAGHDLTYLAQAGLLGSELPRTLVADVLGSERAFSAAVLLLRQAPGARAEVGLYDALEPLIAPLRHGLTKPGGLLGGALPSYGLYEAGEGRIAVAALEPHFRARLYEALGLSPGTALGDAFRMRGATEWERWAVEHDLPISAVRE